MAGRKYCKIQESLPGIPEKATSETRDGILPHTIEDIIYATPTGGNWQLATHTYPPPPPPEDQSLNPLMAKPKTGGGGGEHQVQKSPAEFFAEHQAIAGFDNLGKSLYTSLRELIENSLDACESIGELPSVSVTMEELTLEEFNVLRGISIRTKDVELFHNKTTVVPPKPHGGGLPPPTTTSTTSAANGGDKHKGSNNNNNNNKRGNKNNNNKNKESYFKIVVRDNGCGMHHDKIPDLLGRVLSGSKYGVRQTRGKFGLGAKMALIWSKKSTGVPIHITTAHRPTGGGAIPTHYSTCTLDIDIAKNEPKIIAHQKHNNAIKQWIGTELAILIAGNFTTYKARIVQYLRELAIVTPYAEIKMEYSNRAEPHRNLQIRYDRRSEQMPPPAKQVKHHPSSVNNLVVQQLIDRTKQLTVPKFLEKELACVTSSIAHRICQECGVEDHELHPTDLNDRQITKLVQVLRTVSLFKAPDGTCLSPLGEYNLNLGIRKVLEPDYVATARDRPCAYEGHPFVVEAAVSLGGKDVKEGINVVRFANRIPLLFEAGADVTTRVANTKIKWSSYKIDHKRDRIGVFVSIVSTKIPYKGTGKEYIGDDITEISNSVKRALQSCCQQLRTHLQKRNALRDQQERKSRLTKYIPDVTRSLLGLLEGIQERHKHQLMLSATTTDSDSSPRKRPRLGAGDLDQVRGVVHDLESGAITATIIKERLEQAVMIQSHLEEEEEKAAAVMRSTPIPIYLTPLFDFKLQSSVQVIEHPLFSFYPMKPVSP
jgi:DNA topoisomerase VI subunit B